MIYVFPFTLPPNTLKANPVRKEVNLVKGRIIKLGVVFPPGCLGLCGIRVIEREHQLFPSNTGEWFTGDDIDKDFEEDYPLLYPPFILKIEAYNEDDTYSHTVTLRILLREEGYVSLYPLTLGSAG